MSEYLTDGYHRETPAAYAPVDARVAFIQRTYLHLGAAVLAFVGLEAALIHSGAGVDLLQTLGANRLAWLGLMALFIGGGMLAQYWARSNAPPAMQYLGLALYVGIEAIFFLPILTICALSKTYADIPVQAGILTLTVFGGLSLTVILSKRDFSFMGFALRILGFAALGLVIVALITGLTLGVWFSVAMIALACGFILYDTSNVLHHYPTNAHVAASLALFASLALLFYYILRLMMQLSSSND
jgi:uncharacterized protein